MVVQNPAEFCKNVGMREMFSKYFIAKRRCAVRKIEKNLDEFQFASLSD